MHTLINVLTRARSQFKKLASHTSLRSSPRLRTSETRDELGMLWNVEQLEHRQMLAGNVSAVMTNAGTLRITGSNDSNQIVITDDGFGNVVVSEKPALQLPSMGLQAKCFS